MRSVRACEETPAIIARATDNSMSVMLTRPSTTSSAIPPKPYPSVRPKCAGVAFLADTRPWRKEHYLGDQAHAGPALA